MATGDTLQIRSDGHQEFAAPSGGGGGASDLDDLTDVDTTGATDDDVLTYASGSWTPQAPAGGGGGVTWPLVAPNDTYAQIKAGEGATDGTDVELSGGTGAAGTLFGYGAITVGGAFANGWGGAINASGGNAETGGIAGWARIKGGSSTGHAGASITAHGGNSTLDGSLEMDTTSSTAENNGGVTGQALVSNGGARVHWGGVIVGAGVPSDPPDGFLPFYINTSASNALYVWDGTSSVWRGPYIVTP